MKIYRFGPPAGKILSSFDSRHARLSGIAHLQAEAQVSNLYLEPDGMVGLHPASTPQLFLVVSGSGWVYSETSGRVPISAGQAAYWEKGEQHASGTDSGLTAVIIESERLDPAEFMPDEGT